MGDAPAAGCARSSPRPAPARRSTRRATSGSRSARAAAALLIGGHLDSVPNGGWLDGCLNVVAGAEVLRRIAEEGTPPVTVGSSTGPTRRARASGGRSSAPRPRPARCATRTSCAKLADRDGVALPDALARARRRARPRARGAQRSSQDAGAYLELHIEQGPVLESLGLPLGVVLGTFGVERSRVTWHGQAAHAGSTPMDQRRDALAGAAKLALEIRAIAREAGGGAVCTSGGVVCRPGHRHLGRRDGRAAARPAAPRRRHARRGCSPPRRPPASASPPRRTSRSSGSGSGRSSRSSFDETLIGLADEAVARGRRQLAPAAVRPAARRGRGRAGGRADGDALRAEPARPLAHEARGHEARAPRARGRALDRLASKTLAWLAPA